MLTLRALVLFVRLDAAFRRVGFPGVYRRLMWRPAATGGPPAAEGRRRAQATFRAVQRATMLYYRTRKDCLPQALTTVALLRRQGIAAELCFGVKKFPFSAHTWVEAGGEVLDDDPPRIERYTVIHRAAV